MSTISIANTEFSRPLKIAEACISSFADMEGFLCLKTMEAFANSSLKRIYNSLRGVWLSHADNIQLSFRKTNFLEKKLHNIKSSRPAERGPSTHAHTKGGDLTQPSHATSYTRMHVSEATNICSVHE